jgi:hypothetical protein
MFEYSNDEDYRLQINPNSAMDADQLMYFQFVGKVGVACACLVLIVPGPWSGNSESAPPRLHVYHGLLQAVALTAHHTRVWMDT